MATTIIVVGLGPGAWAQVTLEARDVLAAARTVWLRTTTHPTAAHLPAHLRVESFDYLYEREAQFADIYRQIAESLLARAGAAGADEPLVYAVPGHPRVGEASVRHLLTLARAAGVPVRIVAGLSFLEPVCTALDIDPLERGLQILDGTELGEAGDPAPASSAQWLKPQPGTIPTAAQEHEPFYFSPYALPLPPEAFPALQGLSPLLPALVTQVYNDRVAGAVKLALLEKYPPEHPVSLVIAAGVPGAETVRRLPLAEIDRGQGINHLACLYLPPLDPLAHPRDFDSLIYLMGRLRGPGGCPWDREQTHESLAPYLREETYEVLDAIAAGDPAHLAEELGDVLLQVVFHAQVGVSAEEFTLGDVVQAIVTKLVRRHPHVFGEVAVEDAAGVTSNWEKIKAGERATARAARGEDAATEELEVTGQLRRIPRATPALDYAQQISQRAVDAGFEWNQLEDVFAKVHEELEEMRAATDPAHRAEELGDLLFTLVNVARWWGLNAEETMRASGAKFIRRFAAMERLAQADGAALRGIPVEALEAYWQAAKRAERA